MNKLKDHAQSKELHYFLTYADNNAIEYFRKQGFAQNPDLPEPRWKGYIKDYNGSTMMQCTIQRHIRHSTLYMDIRKQKDALIKEVLKFIRFKKHPGLDFSGPKKEYQFEEIAGLREAGWDKESYLREKEADERSFEDQCGEVLEVLLQHENSWPFRKPVDKEKVRDYYEVIKHPMDLESVQKKVELGIQPRSQEEVKKPPVDDDMIIEGKVNMEPYTCMDDFRADIKQIFDNARTYNGKETIFYKYAQ